MDLKTAAKIITETILDAPNGGPVEVEWLDAEKMTAWTTGSISPSGKLAHVSVWKDELGGIVFVAKHLRVNKAPHEAMIPVRYQTEEQVLDFAQHAYQMLRLEAQPITL